VAVGPQRIPETKAYLDNSVISAKVKNEFLNEIIALSKLLKMFASGTLELVTSEVTLKEIEAYLGEMKCDMKDFFALLKGVPLIEDHTVLGFHSQWSSQGGGSYPLVQDDSVSSSIRKILQKKKQKNRVDAHHLMVAIKGGCDVFLTLDHRTILKYGAQIENNFPIHLMKPSELLKELSQ
jgi:predicted nucleic acid-binding protein